MKSPKPSIILLPVMVFAALVCVPLLTGSFWLDEAAQALESSRPLSQQLDIIPDFQPPLLHLIIHFTLYVSRSEWWLRLIGAVIPGLVTVWTTYRIGEKLGHRSIGIMAAVLLATSSLHVFFSQELRPYMLAVMWAVLSWEVLLSGKITKTGWLKFVLYTTAGLYSTFLYPFLLVSQVVFMIFAQRERLKPFLFASIASGIAFLPWLPTLKLQLAAGAGVRRGLPGWETVVSFTQLKSIPLVAGKFLFGVIDLEPTVWIVTSFMAIGVLLILSIWLTLKKPHNRSSVLNLLIWLGVPLISVWIFSFWIPVIQPKRVLFLLPAWYLLISLLATSLSQQKNKISQYLAWSLPIGLLVINIWSLFQYWRQPLLQREDWRALHQQIVTQYPPPTAIVVMSAPEPFAPWEWYDQDYPTISTQALSVGQVASLPEVLKPVIDYRYVLVFDYLRDLSDPDDQILATLRSFGYEEIGALDQSNIGFVRIYAKKPTILSINPIINL